MTIKVISGDDNNDDGDDDDEHTGESSRSSKGKLGGLFLDHLLLWKGGILDGKSCFSQPTLLKGTSTE